MVVYYGILEQNGIGNFSEKNQFGLYFFKKSKNLIKNLTEKNDKSFIKS